MIESSKFIRPLDDKHIIRFFNDAYYGALPPHIPTNGAGILFGDIRADAACVNALLQRADGVGERSNFLVWLLKQI